MALHGSSYGLAPSRPTQSSGQSLALCLRDHCLPSIIFIIDSDTVSIKHLLTSINLILLILSTLLDYRSEAPLPDLLPGLPAEGDVAGLAELLLAPLLPVLGEPGDRAVLADPDLPLHAGQHAGTRGVEGSSAICRHDTVKTSGRKVSTIF